MARTIVVMIVAAVIGAAVFHLYYRDLDPTARCGWDHPIDREARRTCATVKTSGYAPDARRQLDDLVGSVSR